MNKDKKFRIRNLDELIDLIDDMRGDAWAAGMRGDDLTMIPPRFDLPCAFAWRARRSRPMAPTDGGSAGLGLAAGAGAGRVMGADPNAPAGCAKGHAAAAFRSGGAAGIRDARAARRTRPAAGRARARRPVAEGLPTAGDHGEAAPVRDPAALPARSESNPTDPLAAGTLDRASPAWPDRTSESRPLSDGESHNASRREPFTFMA